MSAKVIRMFSVSYVHVFTLWFERKQHILVARLTQKSVRYLRTAQICQNGATLMWRDTEETNYWIKSLFFCFLFIQKLFSSLHITQIARLMTDGVFWRCFSYFPGPWHCYLFGSHKPPGFHPKYLKLCSEDERSFMGLERHGGKWIMTKFSFCGGVTL